jgi:DNA polymerase III epsilon subunit-like protein
VVAEITEEAFEKHGLTKEDLEGLPFFKEDAQMIYDNFLTQGVVICGFNSNKFDIPFIIEKMLQSKIVEAVSITRNKTIDAILIYRELYPNTLEGIHKRLVGKELENSHDAKEDIYGTIRILDALLKVHPDISLVTTSETIDAGGFFKRVENNVFFDKGKLKGQNILTMDKTEATGFLGWMTRTSSISIHSRTIAQKLIDKLVPTTV